MAKGASDNFFAKARALATPPTSGETTTKSLEQILFASKIVKNHRLVRAKEKINKSMKN